MTFRNSEGIPGIHPAVPPALSSAPGFSLDVTAFFAGRNRIAPAPASALSAPTPGLAGEPERTLLDRNELLTSGKVRWKGDDCGLKRTAANRCRLLARSYDNRIALQVG
jgi:hypothetical protein